MSSVVLISERARVREGVAAADRANASRAAAAVCVSASPAARRPPPLHCFSVDVEEYYHAEVFARVVDADARRRLPRRAAPFVEAIADMLAARGSRATFFVLGDVVVEMASTLRALVAAGHEIACHGFGHAHLARMTPAALREDLRRARGIIEDTLGVRPCGYRAPTFSLTRRTAWALDVIIEAGFSYDASVFPIRHDRYGVPAAPACPFIIASASGQQLVEFPPMTAALGPWRLPIGGGGYLRLLPLRVVDRSLRAAAARGEPQMMYVHPWELDVDQPRLPVGPLSQWRHRVGMPRLREKLSALLRMHRFDAAAAVVEAVASTALPTFTLWPREHPSGSRMRGPYALTDRSRSVI